MRTTASGRFLFDDPIPDHPLLAGKAEIGRGESSVVFDCGNDSSVLKLISDPAAYDFSASPSRPQGRHYPQLLADHGVVGSTRNGFPLHLIEQERLYPIAPDSAAAALAAQIGSAYYEACRAWAVFAGDMGSLALSAMCRTPLGWSDDVHDALQALSRFTADFQVLPDLLNRNNLMVRADGTLVFADPVFFG